MCRRRARRRRSCSRSTTTPTARSSSRPIWRSGRTARATSRSPSSTSGATSRSPVAHARRRGRAGARDPLRQRAISTCRPDSPAHRLPDNSGFAGFRFQEARAGKLDWRKNDWVAFLGASYFRAIGELYQYGLSARGPRGRRRGLRQARGVPELHACLFRDAGAGSDTRHGATPFSTDRALPAPIRFVMQPRRGGGHGDREARIFLRQDVEPPRHRAADLDVLVLRETAKPTAIDWRPEIHDSDGLAHLDRRRRAHLAPAQQPAADHRPRPSPTSDPQRLRPAAARPQLRPLSRRRRITTAGPRSGSSRIGDWGQGAIQLVEIPTDDEIHDNIVAIWVPAEPAAPGRQLRCSATACTGSADEPYPTAARALRRDPARQWRAGRHGSAEGRAQVHGRVHGRAADPARHRRDARAGAVRPRAGAFSNILTEAVPDDVPGHWRAAVRPHRRPGPSRSSCAATCAGRRGAQRDLALPVPPERLSGCRFRARRWRNP